MLTGRELYLTLLILSKVSPEGRKRMLSRAPHIRPLLKRLKVFVLNSIELDTYPPACLQCVSQKAMLEVWLDSLIQMDQLARLNPAVIRSIASVN